MGTNARGGRALPKRLCQSLALREQASSCSAPGPRCESFTEVGVPRGNGDACPAGLRAEFQEVTKDTPVRENSPGTGRLAGRCTACSGTELQ